MILDTIQNASHYLSLSGNFKDAFKFLQRTDLRELALGRHEINGDMIYASISRGPGRSRQESRLETHVSYIDIQMVLTGTEEMGWKPRSTCEQPAGLHDEQKDIRFYLDLPDTWFSVRPGQFAVFFPEDAHMPMISPDEIHKVVIKIKVA